MANLPIILLVEDDHELLDGLGDVLEGSGFDVMRAENGVIALQQLREAPVPPSLIISDIDMPEMDGYQLLEAVRQHDIWLEIPVIFLTALSSPPQVRQGLVAGIDHYVTKPFETSDLLLIVQNKLNRREQIRRAATDQMRQIKRDILTILNHEFRTPLTPVIAYAEMLAQDIDELSAEDMKQFVDSIRSGAWRLERLVTTLILLVELETGEARQTFQTRRTIIYDVNDILYQLQQYVQPVVAQRQLQLNVHPPLTTLPTFIADPEYLIEALKRLLDNAVKFSDKPNTAISLSIYPGEDRHTVLISVADQGRGIPQKELDAIFDPFYQVNRPYYEDQGIGAGLTIVRRIAELHGGEVYVESVFGEGSVFTFSLPALKD
jgi:signal transduction histidine kinase